MLSKNLRVFCWTAKTTGLSVGAAWIGTSLCTQSPHSCLLWMLSCRARTSPKPLSWTGDLKLRNPQLGIHSHGLFEQSFRTWKVEAAAWFCFYCDCFLCSHFLEWFFFVSIILPLHTSPPSDSVLERTLYVSKSWTLGHSFPRLSRFVGFVSRDGTRCWETVPKFRMSCQGLAPSWQFWTTLSALKELSE